MFLAALCVRAIYILIFHHLIYVVNTALASTGFLIGPKSQCNKMWDPTRRVTTTFYLTMILVVFIVAVCKQNVFLVLALLFIEILAATWYSISYIPFGRKIVCQFFRSTGVCSPCFYVSDSIKECRASKNKSTTSSSGSTSKSGGGLSSMFGSSKK